MSNLPQTSALLKHLIQSTTVMSSSALDLASLWERPHEDIEDEAYKIVMQSFAAAIAPFDHSVSNPFLDGLNETGDGPVATMAKQIALAYDAPYARIGVNGTTGLNRTILGYALPSISRRDGVLIMDRGGHLSALPGLIDSGLEVHWIKREYDPLQGCEKVITPCQVERALAIVGKRAVGVFLTSPTYDGAILDVPAISEVCREHDVLLGIDGAWGVGLGLFRTEYYPENPITQGANFVTISIHKKGLAPSQVSVALFSDKQLVDAYDVAAQLVDTTSPNFAMVALAQHHLLNAMDTEGQNQWSLAAKTAAAIRDMVEQSNTPMLPVDYPSLGASSFDPSHVAISLANTNVSGFALHSAMSKRNMDAEKATFDTVLLLIGPDHAGKEDLIFDGISMAFMDALQLAPKGQLPHPPALSPAAVLTPRQAFFSAKERIPLAGSVGRVAASVVCVYPPGSPLIIPGEKITQEQVDFIQSASASGGKLRGVINSHSNPLVSVIAKT